MHFIFVYWVEKETGKNSLPWFSFELEEFDMISRELQLIG